MWCLRCFGRRRDSGAHFAAAEVPVRDRVKHAASLVKQEDGRYPGGLRGIFRGDDPWSAPREPEKRKKKAGMLGKAEATAKNVDWWAGASRKGEAYQHKGDFVDHNDWWNHVQHHHGNDDDPLQFAWSGHGHDAWDSEWSGAEAPPDAQWRPTKTNRGKQPEAASRPPAPGAGGERRGVGVWDEDSDDAEKARRLPKPDRGRPKPALAAPTVASAAVASSLAGTATAPVPTRRRAGVWDEDSDEEALPENARLQLKPDRSAPKQALAAPIAASAAVSSLVGTATAPVPVRRERPAATTVGTATVPPPVRGSHKPERLERRTKAAKSKKEGSKPPADAAKPVPAHKASPAVLPPPDPWADSGGEGDDDRPRLPPKAPPRCAPGPAAVTAPAKGLARKTPKAEDDAWGDSDGSGRTTDPGKPGKARPAATSNRGSKPSKSGGARRTRQSSKPTSEMVF